MTTLVTPARRLVGLTALALACCGGGGTAEAGVILPADARGIRQFPEVEPFLLDFLAINRSIEDRTVIEFDVSGLSGTIPRVTLDLDLQNLDPGGPGGIIEVFTFSGDGAVLPEEFDAGTLFTSFENNQSGLEHVDVTAAVQSAVDAGEPFLGFRLATASDDRYFLGPPFTPAGPTLTLTVVIPEPSGLVLVGTAAALGWASALRRPARAATRRGPRGPHGGA